MKPTPAYPPELLQSSPEQRKEYFKEKVVEHAQLSDVVNKLDRFANGVTSRRLILLVGATGAGKSTAQHLLVAKRKQKAGECMGACPEHVPAIRLEAEPPDKGAFNFASLYKVGLAALGAALPNQADQLREFQTPCGTRLMVGATKSERQDKDEYIRMRFRSELQARRTSVVCIDEAVNLFKIGRPASLAERTALVKHQADKIKAMTNLSGTALVLTGASDFAALAASSGQNSRRSRVVHFLPYSQHSTEDVSNFLRAYTLLLQHLPGAHDIDPVKTGPEVMLRSLGLVGIAHDLLLDAFSDALDAEVPMTFGHLEANFFDDVEFEAIRTDVQDSQRAAQRAKTAADLADEEERRSAGKSDSAPIKRSLKPGESKPTRRASAFKA